MITQKKLTAGKPGTRKWMKKYGEDFLCLRYKYDPDIKMKIKTVELVVEREPWEKNLLRIPENKTVFVRVEYGEVHIGKMLKSVGGIWDRQKRLWEVKYGHVKELGLTKRIVHK